MKINCFFTFFLLFFLEPIKILCVINFEAWCLNSQISLSLFLQKIRKLFAANFGTFFAVSYWLTTIEFEICGNNSRLNVFACVTIHDYNYITTTKDRTMYYNILSLFFAIAGYIHNFMCVIKHTSFLIMCTLLIGCRKVLCQICLTLAYKSLLQYWLIATLCLAYCSKPKIF